MKKGFTLIELLVVITIIGLLASIVLASVRNSQDKAKDTSAISSISSIRSVVELYHSENGTYAVTDTSVADPDNICFEPEVLRVKEAAEESTGYNWTCDYDSNSPIGEGYHILIRLTSGATYFCIDHTGFAGVITSFPGPGQTCDKTGTY